MSNYFTTEDNVRYKLVEGFDKAENITDFRQTSGCFSAYEVNPALGCGFGCHYCSMYGQNKDEEHMPVTIYKDYPEYLANFVENHHNRKKLLFNVSPKTDFFSSELIESGVTREILTVFRNKNVRFYTLTKGRLPTPDIQKLLIETKEHNQVIFSAGLPDLELEQLLEPGAPSSRERMEFAKFCNGNGITTSGIAAPYLPLGDSETYQRKILEQFKNAGIIHCSVHVLKLSADCLDRMCTLLPEHKNQLRSLYFQPDVNSKSTIDWKLPGDTVVTRSYAKEDYMRQTLLDFKIVARDLGMTVSTCTDVCGLIRDKTFNHEATSSGYNCVGYVRKKSALRPKPVALKLNSAEVSSGP